MTMKKILLTIGLVVVSLTTMAQSIFEYGFEAPQSPQDVGSLSYVGFKAGDTRDSASTVAFHNGEKSLMLLNATPDAANTDRTLKFRNLPLEPNTAYRVSFWIKGGNGKSIRLREMTGIDGQEVNIVAAGNASYEQTFSGIYALDSLNWRRSSAQFFFTHDSIQGKLFNAAKPDSLIKNNFLALNVFGSGQYFIDDVKIERSSINNITFAGYILKVNFGYAIDFASLYNDKDYLMGILPTNCVTVTNDGTPLDIESVEVHRTGFYIFLMSDFLDDTSVGHVKVSFNNPTDPALALKYTDAKRPFSWDAANDRRVLDFADEDVTYDANLDVTSSVYMPPFVKSVSPENESFEMDQAAVRTFTIRYNRDVKCDAATAVLVGKTNINMIPLQTTGTSDTLMFKIPDGVTLADGEYTLSVRNVISASGETPHEKPDNFMFAFGPDPGGLVRTVLADSFYLERNSTNANANGNERIPRGWKSVSPEHGVREENTGQWGGPRLFFFSNVPASQFGEAFYTRTREFVLSDSSHLLFGTYKNRRLRFTPGKYKVSFYFAGWKEPNQPISVIIRDTFGVEILREYGKCPTKLGNPGVKNGNGVTQVVTGATLNEFSFIIQREDAYIMDFEMVNRNGQFIGKDSYLEIVMAKIRLVGIPSTATLYKDNLTVAMTAAKTAKTACDSTLYDSPMKTALINAITAYDGVSYHSPTPYNSACAILNAATGAMLTHKSKVDNYFTALKNANDKKTATLGTKYEVLVVFNDLLNALNRFASPVMTEDASLQLFTDSLTYFTNKVTGVVASITPLTFGINKAIALAEGLKIPVPAAALAPAKAAVDEDMTVLANLRNITKQYIYGNLAVDSIKFRKDTIGTTSGLDSIALVNLKKHVVDSLDLSYYMNNSNMYTRLTSPSWSNNTFPGWTVIGGGAISFFNGNASATAPVVDNYISVWSAGNFVQQLKQTVSGLPSGVYDFGFRTRIPVLSGAQVSNMDTFYVWVQHKDTTYKKGYWQGSVDRPDKCNTWIAGVKVLEGESVTLGFHAGTPTNGFQPTCKFGDPEIYMVARAPGVLYDGVQNVKHESVGNVEKEKQYYSIQGMRLNSPIKGINIVRTIYTNGTVKIEKKMYK